MLIQQVLGWFGGINTFKPMYPRLGESRSHYRFVLALQGVYGGRPKKSLYNMDLPERSEGVPELKNDRLTPKN